MMSRILNPIAWAAGARPTRRLVNTGLRASARLGSPRVIAPARVQAAQLRRLLRKAQGTRFGREHGFKAILERGRSGDEALVAAFQQATPLRTYEQLWKDYIEAAYPTLDDLTWPGRMPYFALTSGTTQGATKYIPVSREMVASNRAAGWETIRTHFAARAGSRLFHGKLFALGGSTALEEPAPGVRQGDLSAIAALEVNPILRSYTFPPLDLALESDWERKLTLLAERSLTEPITMVAGVPSWLLLLFQKLQEFSGRATVAEIWPQLECVVHGGVKFEPYRPAFEQAIGSDRVLLHEIYPCSEGFVAIGDPATGLLRPKLDHGLFYEFVPIDSLGSERPERHWFGTLRTGVNYAIVVSTCAGMWAHIIGDTVRFESLDPPLLTFTGRTKYTLSAFGEHLISEEVEGAMAEAGRRLGAAVLDWHVGPVFEGDPGRHRFLVEFDRPPDDLEHFRDLLDADLKRRNADYEAHRAEGVGLPAPEVVELRRGGFADWMRSRGKLGGQHKVPRMDDTGRLAAEMTAFLNAAGRIERVVGPDRATSTGATSNLSD